MANKNSTYIGSLTSFILDTKPYRSKLTEVQEIYQFYDEMTVRFQERLFSRVLTKAAWPYTYFSGGVGESIPGVGQPMTLHQLVSPLVRGHTRNNDPLECRGAFKAFRDESTDLPLVPFAFDPRQLQGAGLSDAFIQRNGLISQNEALLEGHDVFLSKGAYVFQIKQATNTQPLVIGRYTKEFTANDGPYPVLVELPFTNADSLVVIGPVSQNSLTEISVTGPGIVKVAGLSSAPNYQPTFTERQKENLLAEATSVIQSHALDVLNPNSAVSQLKVIMNQIAGQLASTPHAPASAELALIQGILDTPALPNSYEGLLNALIDGNVPVIAGYVDWRGQDITAPYTDKYVDDVLSALSPSMYFNTFTDLNNREGGVLRYANVEEHGVLVKNITSNPIHPTYEEWSLTAITETTFLIKGGIAGSIGTVDLGTSFVSPRLGFSISGSPVPVGTTLLLTPQAKVTIHYEAPLEAWSLIKVNPRAYSRPVFTSTRYGFLRSQTLVPNYITILDRAFPTTTLALTAVSSTKFTLTSAAEPAYLGDVTVNVPFNDGRVAFTIVNGTAYAFRAGDKFYIEIDNPAPIAEDLDLYYGYDFDSYDAGEMVYNNVSDVLADYLTTLDFGYGSRFLGYDLDSFNMVLDPAVEPDVQWRLRALPNLSMPVNLHPEGTDENTGDDTLVNQVNLIATNDPENPFAIQRVDMVNDVSDGIQSANDPDTVADMLLWYATSFALEYYDEASSSWVTDDTVYINVPYTSVHGFSFTIVQAGKPFIAAELNSSRYQDAAGGAYFSETTFGGDVIAWTVRNKPPVQTEASMLVSRNAPRLIMYGDSYHFSTPAHWTLTYTATSQYALQGTFAGGMQNGQQVFNTPVSVQTTVDGRSYKNEEHGLHFTVVNGSSGLAPSDKFTFTTYERKPSILVHGSVSGWQPDAVIGEWYWNGKIGFKIPAAKALLFDAAGTQLGGTNPWGMILPELGFSTIALNYLRPDAPSARYHVKSHSSNYWTLYRNGAVVGHGQTVVKDKYISLSMPSLAAGSEFVISVQGIARAMSLGHDLAIVRTSSSRLPTANDFVLLERTESDTLSISVKPAGGQHTLDLLKLGAVTTDLRFVDHGPNNGALLAGTSPETGVLQGWLPLTETRFDRGLSSAEFSDAQHRVVVQAAGTGETIGEVLSLGTKHTEPVIFRWNPDFHNKYLPLNTEATVVTLGSGMNDRVQVNMTDDAMFLITGGGLLDDMLFTETMQANIADTTLMSVKSQYADSTDITISDGPFAGFLPGYDNLRFDFESGSGDVNDEDSADGYYDAGVALTDWFQQAQALSLLPSLNPMQQALLNDLLGAIDPWLDGDVVTTTLAEFTTNVGANPPSLPLHNSPLNWTPTSSGFGIPAVGMGMQVETASVNTASANIVEAASILIADRGYAYDQLGFGVGEMDDPAETTVVMFSSASPPIPSTGLSGLTTYVAFDSTFFIPAPGARVVELSFLNAVPSTPAFYLWRPSDSTPVIIPIVERLSDRRFRFSLPAGSELKLVIG